MTRRVRLPLCLLVLAAIVAGCAGPGPTRSPGSSSAAPSFAPSGQPNDSPSPAVSVAPGGSFDPARVGLTLESVVSGLSDPLAVTHAGDGSGRLFVAEQGGQDPDRSRRDPRGRAVPRHLEADLRRRRARAAWASRSTPTTRPTRGSSSTTRTPTATRASPRSRSIPPTPDRADPGSEVRLVSIGQPYANHNGGALAFGPDGFLYIATGDGGSGGDPHGNGQSLETLLGKILRIDVDRTEGSKAYAIPADNPFVGEAAALPEIFAYGMRNPWRMSFDRATGDLWIGDVGQGAWEEIDVVRAGTSGQNFGWNLMEGAHCFRPAEGCEDPSLVLPVTEYTRNLGSTVIGGVVYRGSDQPALVGGYVFADYGSGNVWLIDAATDGPTDPVLALESGATISSFGEDEGGEVYATDLASGELLRVVAVPR